MKKLLAATLFLVSIHSGVFGQQRPMVTEPVETVEAGHLRFEMGFEFLQDAVFPFSGLEGDLTRLGVLGFRLGVGKNVELQLLGTVQNVLNIDRQFPAPNTPNLNIGPNDDSTSDVGDFTLAAKVRFKQESSGSPGLGFRFGFEMPNASNENGLGNDELNAFGSFLIEKRVGRARLIGNLGIALLGDPVDTNAQDDLFTYGAALIFEATDKVNLLVDLNGRAGDAGIGTEEQANLRLGAQFKAGGLYWDVGAYFGLHDTDPDTGVIIGVSKGFKLWDF
jgi:hypothetical protein